MAKNLLCTIVAACLLTSPAAQASSILSGEYVVDVTATSLGLNSWQFTYSVKNLNQQIGSTQTGLDGFLVEVPAAATVYDITVPPSYSSGGWWGGFTSASPSSVYWWGFDPASVYPIGATAVFSFKADNVALGTTPGLLTTYWGGHASPGSIFMSGGYYSEYSTTLVGPVEAIPDGGAGLCGAGTLIALLVAAARKSNG